MFHSIMKAYQLSTENWTCQEPEPQLVEKSYQLYASFNEPPKACSDCKGEKFHKHGTTPKPRLIQLTEFIGRACFLQVTIQRYKCANCGKTWSPSLPQRLVRKGAKNSFFLDQQILRKLQKKGAITEGADDLHVSTCHFYRILSKMEIKTNFNFLPEVLCVDEFKATKDCKGNMAFTAMDGLTHELLVILDDRRLDQLVTFFMTFKRSIRESVKFLVMDMNASYDKLIKTCFPNARVVTDRFHIVQQMTKAFNNERIQIMKKFPSHTKEYRHLKAFWRHLIKPYEELSRKVHYNRRFHQYISSQGIVDILLTYDTELKEAWEMMQVARTHFKAKRANLFFGLIEDMEPVICSESYVKKFQFLLKRKESVQLAMEVPYSNGCLEGMNNKIKALKRAAFGFRKFENLVKRVILMNMKTKNA